MRGILLKRSAILTIAFENFMSLGKTIPIENQTDHHLLAVRALVAGVAALGLGVGFALALEVGRGQVVKIVGVIEIEEALFPLRQGLFDASPVRMEAVQVAVQRLIAELAQIDAEHIAERRALHPFRHRVLRARGYQAIEHHHLTEQLRPRRQTRLAQNLLQAQAPPHLMADMHGPSLARLFQADLIGMNSDDVSVVLRRLPLGRADPTDDTFDQWIRTFQGNLAA